MCIRDSYHDLWYKFVATNTSHKLSLINLSGNTTSMRLSVYEGNCSNLGNTIICSSSKNEFRTTNYLNDLTIGATYYICIFSTFMSYENMSFDLCIGTYLPSNPINDECNNAYVIPVNKNNACTNTINGTLSFATASSQNNTCVNKNDNLSLIHISEPTRPY